MSSPILEVKGLSRNFGQLKAVRDVTFSVRQGELVGLIGPNGAGKSTFYNLIAGAIRPSTGEIIFIGRNIEGWKAHRVARIGIARTFQIPKPYRQLSVVENVMLTAFGKTASTARARAVALDVLADVGLKDYADASVGVLAIGLLKRLEVARALAADPKLILFDEIMAGLTPTEVREMTALVAMLPKRGITVIWVEHVLHAIMRTAHRIVVLNRGELIADGEPSAIAKDPNVVRAYLGEEFSLA
jgi:branched-chain amino acid transport system ATP-binding protein